MARESVKLIHAALDEADDKEIILRGAIHQSSLHLLQVADYQREVLPMAQINSLMKAFMEGSVPDIDLGMRGGSYQERGGVYYLSDPIYIVDGLQRTTAAIELLQRGKEPRLGATVHFSTSEEWERERFRILNADRVRLSPNVLLRNLRHDRPVIEVLHSLTTGDKSFVLSGRVSWAQRMMRQHLITALTLLKTIGVLHSHEGPGRSTGLIEIANGLQTIMDKIGPTALLANVRTFFNAIEEAWGIRAIAFKEGAVYMRGTFLGMLSMLFSRHEDFWRGNKLFIEKELLRKIAQFSLTDPTVRSLTATSGKARYLLYQLMVDHVNSGKRTKRLKIRPEVRLEEEAERIGTEASSMIQIAAPLATVATAEGSES